MNEIPKQTHEVFEREIDDSATVPEAENPNDRRKIMDRALQFGTAEDLWVLLDGGMSVNQEDYEGRTPLMLYTAKGAQEGVEELIQRGADINYIFMYQGRLPMTALDAALQTGNHKLADVLRSHGAKTGKELAGS